MKSTSRADGGRYTPCSSMYLNILSNMARSVVSAWVPLVTSSGPKKTANMDATELTHPLTPASCMESLMVDTTD